MRSGSNGNVRLAAAGWSSMTGERRPARRRDRHRPEVLPLEDRRLLSTFDVTSTADDGSTGTLRWAIAQANAATSPSTIDFNISSGTSTITLTNGPLELSKFRSVTTIEGPGANLLILDGNNASGVFQVDSGVTASLSDLTITGGSASSGGGLEDAGTVNLTGCTISGNSAKYDAAGLENGGTASLTNCTISGNSADVLGGGLHNLTLGTMNLTDGTISDNYAGGGAGLGNSGVIPIS